ncbi:MAG TPA: hypothetical protein VFE62_03310 [Gemmataceae bacterium]|nr:hypothetical protein [Gemmataceae bacterium]
MPLPITRVVLYKHGVGYFEREGKVAGDATLALTFRQTEVSDVLKSLTVLDLAGGHIASVSYDSTKPIEQLLSEVALAIPDQGSLVNLLPQMKGARVALHSGVADPVEGVILGIDSTERQTGDGIVHVVLLSVLTDHGDVRSVDLHSLMAVQLLDPALKRDLDFYLKTQLSAKKKDARTFTFFAQGQGERTIRVSYTLEAPVWKATYRIILGEEAKPPLIQGWAVVDNTQDEDWDNVNLSLIAGLPVSFTHDLYTPRYIRRPEVKVQETTGVLPPEVEEGMYAQEIDVMPAAGAGYAGGVVAAKRKMARMAAPAAMSAAAVRSSTPVQVRERKVGDLFEYEIEHPVTIKRNQSALVPIVLREFSGRPVLLYNKGTRAENPMRCVEFKNTTGLTLEGGPVTVLEAGNYVGEAMLETSKPDDERLVPYCVELAVHALDNIDSHSDRVHRVVIRNGMLRAQYRYIEKTTYHFNNKSDMAQVVYLEHPRASREWKLYETPEPHEITENYWRFRFTIEPKKVTAFVVQAQQALSNQFALADVSDQQLAVWIDQKYVDAKTQKTLKAAIDLRVEAAGIDASLNDLEKERASIHNEQKRIRENLQSIGDRPGEKQLRERYLKVLNAQEDRLEAIDKETAAKIKARDACREKLDALVSKLEYEAEV